MLNPHVKTMQTSSVLFDRNVYANISEDWFLESYWRAHQLVINEISGRGSVFVVRQEEETWVLRHYRRGGFMMQLTEDSYVWTGLERTRSFREWYLLYELYKRGLPVPCPVAAQVIRNGIFYQANIITKCIEHTRSWASMVISGEAQNSHWKTVGMTLRRFHDEGVNHADLNAHNILIDTSNHVFLVDFDRSSIIGDGSWKKTNIKRLLRSLRKVSLETGARFDEIGWKELLRGYNSSL